MPALPLYPTGTGWVTAQSTLSFHQGTLALTDTATATATLLASYGPGGKPTALLILQSDGNLVMYPSAANAATNTNAFWALNNTGTNSAAFSSGAAMALKPNGNLAVTSSTGTLIWGTGAIQNSLAGTGFCLDADTGTIGANGTRVQLWTCNTSNQQNWAF